MSNKYPWRLATQDEVRKLKNIPRKGGFGARGMCPRCKDGNVFKPYVYNDGSLVLFEENGNKFTVSEVGKCDHKNSCKYHVTPKEYVEAHPGTTICSPGKEHQGAAASQETEKIPYYEEPPGQFEITTSVECLSQSRLLGYLRNVMWGCNEFYNIAQVWTDYRVGYDPKSETELFRYYDKDGGLCGIKHMGYQQGSHHRNPKKVWYEPKNQGGVRCFFGEHLVLTGGSINKPIGIVESEKTALVMAIVAPEIVWLSSSGQDTLRKLGTSLALYGRDVMLYPDIDNAKIDKGSWQKIARDGGWRCATEAVPGYLETLEACGEKADIADVVLDSFERKQQTPEMITARAMAKEVPGMWQLMKDFECEVVGAS